MAESALLAAQRQMASFLRDPEHQQPPEAVEARRLKIYEHLVYNNIEGFISGGFPVLRSLYAESDWHELVREFIREHRCLTPYFLEISQEFLQFLMQGRQTRACDPPFMAELAHYEWVELALDVAEDELPDAVPAADVTQAVLRLSPLAWLLQYRFPVHRIGPDFRPGEAGQPSWLVVYRDRQDAVRFMALNAVSARLLELLRDNETETAAAILRRLAVETGVAEPAVMASGAAQLRDLVDRSVVCVVR